MYELGLLVKKAIKIYKNNKVESMIAIIAFFSLIVQYFIFINYDGSKWLSEFGDFFGISAAFLSALVIVLLIRELKEQRESRVKLEDSFKSNAETLNSVKEFFESQADYQKEQINHLSLQNIDMAVRQINQKYQKDIENILFFKSEFIQRKKDHQKHNSFINIIDALNKELDNSTDAIVNLFEVFNSEYYNLEPFMNTLLSVLDKIQLDICSNSSLSYSFLELSGQDISNVCKTEKEMEKIIAVANIIITINGILSSEEKLLFGIYLGVYSRIYKERRFDLSALIYDEIYFVSDSKLKVSRISSSHTLHSFEAVKLIRRLSNHETKK